ncbi:MAG: CZB domain-containing protein [Azonexus sp.]|nr:CZB domain-containing protein [Azonexus sp.]
MNNLQEYQCKSHHECRLGLWYSEQMAHFSGNAAFRAIESPHAAFHTAAADFIAATRAGDADAAKRALDSLENAGSEVIAALDVFAKTGAQ